MTGHRSPPKPRYREGASGRVLRWLAARLYSLARRFSYRGRFWRLRYWLAAGGDRLVNTAIFRIGILKHKAGER